MIDLRATSITKDELLRAWCIEKTIESSLFRDASGQEIVNIAQMLDHFVKEGEVGPEATRAVYDEGAREARFEVKEAVEEWYSVVDLGDLFKTKGWMSSNG